MNREGAWQDLTWGCNNEECICENLRRLYDVIYNIPDPAIRDRASLLVLDSFIMAKKIVDRLWYYKKTYGDPSGHAGESLKKLPDFRQCKMERRARLPHALPEAK